MNKRNWTILGVFALAAILAVPLVNAQPMHGHGGPGGPGAFGELGPLGHLQRLQTQLGLSDQQVTDIKAIVATLHDQNAQYRDQLKGGHVAIINTLLADPNNVAAAQNLLNQQTQAESAMKANMLTAASKALNVLTAEQRAKLAQILADRQARWQNRGK